jgi:hypothetical protein
MAVDNTLPTGTNGCCSVKNCSCEEFFQAENHTRCAACKHPEATHTGAGAPATPMTAGSQGPQGSTTSRSIPPAMHATPAMHDTNVGGPINTANTETYFPANLNRPKPTSPDVQILEPRSTPAPTPSRSSMHIPSYMDEVHQQHRKAKLVNRAPSTSIAATSLFPSQLSFAPDTVEVALLVFFKARGMNIVKNPGIEKHLFNLHTVIPDWHAWLRGFAEGHVAWTDRAKEPVIVFDEDPTRNILVGEVDSISKRAGDPITSKIHCGQSGTIREFFHYAFPKGNANRRQSGGTTSANRPNAKTAKMRRLAIVIPVREEEPEEEVFESTVVKREQVCHIS